MHSTAALLETPLIRLGAQSEARSLKPADRGDSCLNITRSAVESPSAHATGTRGPTPGQGPTKAVENKRCHRFDTEPQFP